MKPSVTSVGFLLLLPLLASKSGSGLEPAVTSLCSEEWLVVRMKRWPFGNDTEVKISDIYLGNNCSATRVLSFNYEFSYPVTNCGIKKIVFPGNDMIMLSEINYRPTLDATYKFDVLCFIRRLILPLMIPFGMNEYDASTLHSRCLKTEDGQQSSAASQPTNREPNLGSYEEHPSNNYCINDVCFITSSCPLGMRAGRTPWFVSQFQ